MLVAPKWGSIVARFLTLFCIFQISLFVLELTPPVQQWFVTPFTELLVLVSISVVTLFDADAVGSGIHLYDKASGFAMSIEAGCNGVEASIVLLAAMIAFPAKWNIRLAGILLGLLSIHVVNIGRIVSLFYIGQWNMEVFDWAHLYVWQALIMLDVFIAFLFWLRYVLKKNDNVTIFSETP